MSSGSTSISQRSGSIWVSFGYFNLYRLVVASVFFFALLFYGRALNLGNDNPTLFAWVSLVYWLLAVFFFGAKGKLDLALHTQLTVQVCVDIAALVLMMHASGGARSGLAVMLLITVAAAGLVGEGRLSLFFAALASIAVLCEQAYRTLSTGADSSDFFQVGILCIGFFATAMTARLLARRSLESEALAHRRGVDLANQSAVNRRVIEDMQDGVLVADREGRVRQFNPQVEMLFGLRAPTRPDLGSFSSFLAEHFPRVVRGEVPDLLTWRIPGTGKNVRARFVMGPGEAGDVLIYLEDLERIEKQAQQMKLAALGRLTANMAHEIRNPLSAISHAAELLGEERRAEMQARLARIIIDNSRRLERLVKEVVQLGRRDRADPETIRLAQFLDAAIDEFVLREQVDRGVLAVDVPAHATIRFDRVHLAQVVGNLVANALRYCSREPGSVRIAAELQGPERVLLNIIDDGPGIPEESRAQVFEPFFTTHAAGTGLGLYIARELCEANGAVLELVSTQQGAHFRIAGRSQAWGEKTGGAAAG